MCRKVQMHFRQSQFQLQQLLKVAMTTRQKKRSLLCIRLFLKDSDFFTGPPNGQYCVAHCRLSSSVMLPAGGPAGRVGGQPPPGQARGQSGGRHCTAGQYGYVPFRRHLVSACFEFELCHTLGLHTMCVNLLIGVTSVDFSDSACP